MPAQRPLRVFIHLISMKRLNLAATFAAATLFLSFGLRAADAAKPANDMKSTRAAEMLKRFDKNGDGKLDDDERAEAKDAMLREQMDRQATRAAALGGSEAERAKMLERFDKNHDGRLDDEERAAAEKAGRERAAVANGPAGNLRAELIRRLDKNADGKIDQAERAAGAEFIADHLDQYPAMKQRFDENHDGKLDGTERAALDRGLQQLIDGAGGGGAMRMAATAPTLENLGPAMREQVLKRFDKDGDGKLNDEERAAFQSEWAKRRPQRGDGPAAKSEGAPKEPPVIDKDEQARLEKTMDDFAPKPAAVPAPKR
jgi:Ca2+-binding EF-hand superfamily protein